MAELRGESYSSLKRKFQLATYHLYKPESIWKNVLCMVETIIIFFPAYLIPFVKHEGGSIVVWSCFAASEPGQLAFVNGTMNSELYS